MEEGPSREELLGMLTGEGYTGGVKKKKRNPWLSFLKKHPGLSMEEASRKYKKKGSGMDGDMEGAGDGEDEYYIEGGKIKKRRKRKKAVRKRRGRGIGEESFGFGYTGGAEEGYEDDFDKTTYKTRKFKDLDKQKQLAWGAYQLWKKLYKKEFDRISRATGAGATEMDFTQFAKENKKSGIELRNLWDAAVNSGAYESIRERQLILFGKEIRDFITDRQVYLFEQGENMPVEARP